MLSGNKRNFLQSILPIMLPYLAGVEMLSGPGNQIVIDGYGDKSFDNVFPVFEGVISN
jgi:hypothetical protein